MEQDITVPDEMETQTDLPDLLEVLTHAKGDEREDIVEGVAEIIARQAIALREGPICCAPPEPGLDPGDRRSGDAQFAGHGAL